MKKSSQSHPHRLTAATATLIITSALYSSSLLASFPAVVSQLFLSFHSTLPSFMCIHPLALFSFSFTFLFFFSPFTVFTLSCRFHLYFNVCKALWGDCRLSVDLTLWFSFHNSHKSCNNELIRGLVDQRTDVLLKRKRKSQAPAFQVRIFTGFLRFKWY